MTGGKFFAALYANPKRLGDFMQAMAGISPFPAKALAQKFPWKNYHTFTDVGCVQGVLPAELVKAHPHLKGVGVDLPAVEPIFKRYIKDQELEESIAFQEGNFFTDDLPQADVITFGRVLQDWSLEQRKVLLAKARAAIAKGGVVVAYDCVIDDARRENTFAPISSLTMMIQTHEGFDYTGEECMQWMQDVGLRNINPSPCSRLIHNLQV